MAFVLFDFFSRNEIEVGRASWITSYFDPAEFTNERWNKKQIVEVGWPKNGTLTQLSPGSKKYPAKVISISDDKAELLALRKMEVGLESHPEPELMGRGHRVKRKSKALNYSSDDTVETEPAKKKKKKQHAARRKESSNFQRLMTEVLQNEMKKNQQPLVHDHVETLQDLRDEISKLKAENEQLQMENRNLRHTVGLIENLPELLNEVKKATKRLNAFRQASSKYDKKEEAEVKGFEDSVAPKTSKPEMQKLASIVARWNTHEPSKFVNDMLTGLYTNEFLSKHSITGTSFKDEESKQRLDPAVVNEIIDIILKHFPRKTPTEVKFYIRQKLNNAAKAMRKRKTIHIA